MSVTPTIVSWASGTDEQIAALLDAAADGDIDLQQDAGWAVGDVRTIHLDSFVGYSSPGVDRPFTNPAENLRIVISSFEEYMNCGNLLQFDFLDCCSTEFSYASQTEYPRETYQQCQIYTRTLPAMANALPNWMKSRLCTFSVLVSNGATSPNTPSIITTPNNKLALRSEVEIFGTTTYSLAGEGSQIAYYENQASHVKYASNGSTAHDWWTRSPDNDNNVDGFGCVIDQSGHSQLGGFSGGAGTAPFGCLGSRPATPTITTQPQDQSVTAGGNASLTVAATGSNLSYLWYYSSDGVNWSSISGATQATYSLTNVQTAAQGYYRCLVYSGNDIAGGVNSNAAYLTVRNAAPIITAQPQNQTVVSGNTATFAVTASGVVYGYQWEVSTDDGATWSNYAGAGANTASISFTATNQDGNKYRCKVSNDGGTVTSNAATLTIETPSYPPEITTQPESRTVTSGNSATFSVVATGDDLSYQWQMYRNGSWYNINGATSSSYTVSASDSLNNSQYHCIVSNDVGSVISDAATLTVNPAVVITTPTITTQPQSVTVQEGSAASFRVAASGGALSYQWQVNNGGTWYDVSGATNAAYNFKTVLGDNGKQYRCVVSNAAGTVTSNAANLTVTPKPDEPVTPVDYDTTVEMQVMIDGVDITAWIAHRGVKWSRNDIDGPGAGRNIVGEMIRDRVSTKMRLDITCVPLKDRQHTQLMNLLMPEFVNVLYKDPVYGVVTKVMYSNNHSSEYLMPRYDGEYWHNITFPLIEK